MRSSAAEACMLFISWGSTTYSFVNYDLRVLCPFIMMCSTIVLRTTHGLIYYGTTIGTWCASDAIIEQ